MSVGESLRRTLHGGAPAAGAGVSTRPCPPGGVAGRCWTLRSRDRLIIPKPFARVVIAVGEPQVVPRELPAEGLEGPRQKLETCLKELVERAEAVARS